MRSRRIVLGADTFPPDINGAARFTQRLADGLAGRGHEVHVLCPSPDGPRRSGREGTVHVHRVPSHRTPFHDSFRICLPWQASRAVQGYLDELAPELVHVQSHFIVGRALANHAAHRGLPLVATNHFMPENLMGHVGIPRTLQGLAARWAWRDLAKVYRQADVLTAPTPRAVRLLTEAGGLAGARAVSCGIDVAGYRRGATRQHVPVVLFVGRLDEEKRVDELLRALAELPPTVPAHAELVGNGSRRRELERLAERLGIADRVMFRGFVTEDELRASYARAAVFCMPGVAELQSLATMEAMAAGLPVVAADAMALPHLVQPGRNGWLFPPGDVAVLADRLAGLLADPGTRRRMGAASRHAVAAHDMNATLDAFEAIYREVAVVTDRLPDAAANGATGLG